MVSTLGLTLAVACHGTSSDAPTDAGKEPPATDSGTGTDTGTATGRDSGPDSVGNDSGTGVGETGGAVDSGEEGEGGAGGMGNMTTAASWFSPSMYFNQPIDTAAVDAESATLISNFVTNGGWGLGRFQIDFSIDVYYASSSSMQMPFTSPTNVIPDDDIPTTVPLDPNNPVGFESSTGQTCDGGDCHYLVIDPANNRLIEIDQANVFGGTITTTGSIAIWSFTKPYTAALRGDVCTGADASGGLMAPLLFTAEEVAAGHIDHAIRFIVPNDRIQNQEYVRPATHGTGGPPSMWAASGGLPYGVRLRLKSTFDASSYSAGGQVVIAALQKYGMILSDGGNISLSAKSDTYSTTKWGSMLGSHDLVGIQPTDFDVVDANYGTDQVSSSMRFDFTSYNCVRTP